MSSFTINGKNYTGNSIRILGNEVWVDGRKVDPQPEPENGILRVDFTGHCQSLVSDAPVTVTGNVGDVRSGGSVHCGNVERDVHAGGNVNCGDVLGHVSAGGNVVRGGHR